MFFQSTSRRCASGPDDIPLLVRHFVQQFSRRINKSIETIPSETMSILTRYPWPGNIRELQNVVERAVIVSEGSILEVPSGEFKRAAPTSANKSERRDDMRGVLEHVERDHILTALNRTKGVVAGPNGAAAQLGMKRSTLQLRMRRLGISRNSAWHSIGAE